MLCLFSTKLMTRAEQVSREAGEKLRAGVGEEMTLTMYAYENK
jgi:hypothetical protein